MRNKKFRYINEKKIERIVRATRDGQTIRIYLISTKAKKRIRLSSDEHCKCMIFALLLFFFFSTSMQNDKRQMVIIGKQ